MPHTITIPDDYGSGGKGISPSGSHGVPPLRDALRATLDTGATGKFQAGTATLVAGTVTVDTTIALTANSRILVSHRTRPTGSANYAGLAVVSDTPGAVGVAEFTIEAIIADGSIDSDAAGDVDWMIID